MKVYTAHLKAAAPLVLLREGWSWGAFLFGPLWLLAKRAWVPGVISLAAVVALAPAAVRVPALLGLAWLQGLLGRDLVRWSLARRGYELAHVLAERSEDAALARLLAARTDLLERLQ